MIRIAKTFTILVLLFVSTISAQENWKVIGDMKNPVSRAQAVVYGSKIYLFGGYSSELQAPVDWIQEYDPVQNSWKIVGKLNVKRNGAVAVTINNSVMLFGGGLAATDEALTLEDISLQNNFVSSVISSHFNFDRTFASGIAVDSSIFIVGGFSTLALGDEPKRETSANKDYLPFITEYSVAQDTFLYSLDSMYNDGYMPSMQTSVAVGNDLYLFGGVYSGILQSIAKFNAATKQYEVLNQELLIPRAGGAAVYDDLHNQIYIIGGYHELNPSLTSVEVYDLYNPNAETTESINPMKYGRKSPTAVYFEGKIYVFGGEDINGNVVSKVEVYDGTATALVDESGLPNHYDILEQNYPNPFNPETNITFNLRSSRNVTLDVYSILGEHIVNLVDKNMGNGKYNVVWNGKDNTGNIVPSGVYIYQLKTDNSILTKKMSLLK